MPGRDDPAAIGVARRSLREITVAQLSLVTMMIPREREREREREERVR